MLIKELSAYTQRSLLNALCAALGGWTPSEKFKSEFPNFKVSELSEYFDVSKHLAPSAIAA